VGPGRVWGLGEYGHPLARNGPESKSIDPTLPPQGTPPRESEVLDCVYSIAGVAGAPRPSWHLLPCRRCGARSVPLKNQVHFGLNGTAVNVSFQRLNWT
jgi:hypothetical protein